jgi:uncharacterized repeat protein (TIGR03803 family)
MMHKTILVLSLALALLVPLNAQQFRTVYSFGAPGDPANPWVSGTLSQTLGGSLISSASGIYNSVKGEAYEITLSGKLTILQEFNNYGRADSGLTLATDERFHGTVANGGKYNDGAVYRMSSTPGSIIDEHDFSGGSDGDDPTAPPIQSMAGDFYGTTAGDYTQNPSSLGTVYKISKSGDYSVLHNFMGPDGANPVGPLVQSSDGSFYGTTQGGGQYGNGTIFRINSDGSFRLLHSFNNADGSGPNGPLIVGNDGNLYGLASGGGSGSGTAFKITPGGTFTLLSTFGYVGAYPNGGLVEATDGNFYGTLSAGGSQDWGTLFKLTPAGLCSKIYDFQGASDGFQPMGTLLQHTNGKLYGQTYLGGQKSGGVLFEFDAGLPPFVTYLNVYGVVGARVEILGQGFKDGVTKVYFNGAEGEDLDTHPTYIKATVPEGATTGPIIVTTGAITLKSNKPFIVH